MATYNPITGLSSPYKSYTDYWNTKGNFGGQFQPYDSSGPWDSPTGAGPSGGAPSDPGAPSGPQMPNFTDILNSDPWLRQYNLDMMAQSASDKASRDAAIDQGLIRYGEVPDQFQVGGIDARELQSILTPEVRQLAQQNTSSGMSLKARTAQTYQDTLSQVKNVLAARGALQSGETGYQLGRTDQDYNRTVYDQKNQLLDYVNGVQQGYVAAERARQQSLFQAQLEALQRAWAQGAGGGAGGGSGGGSTPPTSNGPTATQSQTDFYNQNPGLAGPYQPYNPILGQPPGRKKPNYKYPVPS